MELVYFFYPKNFTIKKIFIVQDFIATETDVMPPDGQERIVNYILGGKIHTYMGTTWPPRRHTFRPPLKRAVTDSGRDVTKEMRKIEGPDWLAATTWVPIRPKVTWSAGLGPGGFSLQLKIFKKYFLKKEGPVSVEFWC